MFDFFKSKRRKDAEIMNIILEKIFSKLEEGFLLQMVQDGIIFKITPVDEGYFNIIFGEKSGLYERQKPKINVLFSKIQLTDIHGISSDFEILVENNLIVRLHLMNVKCDWRSIDAINTDFAEKTFSSGDNFDIEKLQKFGFVTDNIPSSSLYEIDIDGKKYLHLRDIGDGDFIGLYKNKLYWCIHDEGIKVISASLYDFFRQNIFQANEDEIMDLLVEK